MSNLPAQNKKFNLIQNFRGLAVLLVVFYHITEIGAVKLDGERYLGNIFSFGSSGVDFFFVLSGFIIMYVHRLDIGNQSKFTPFLIKRFIRVYPVYWIVTLFTLLINCIIPVISSKYDVNFSSIITSFLLIPQKSYPIVVPAWTLMHEVFFYAMFSLLIVLKSRLSIPIVFSWLLATLILFVSKLCLGFANIPFVGFILSPYNLEFALGCLAALLIWKTKKTLEPIKGPLLLSIGILLFSLASLFHPVYTVDPINRLLYGIPSFLIVFSSSLIELASPVSIPWLLLYLGDASYSIYLTNEIFIRVLIDIVTVCKVKTIVGSSLTLTIVVSLTILLGCLFYSFVERPVLKLSRTYLLNQKVR
jgi:exopolysaccharide production protein ExoZ